LVAAGTGHVGRAPVPSRQQSIVPQVSGHGLAAAGKVSGTGANLCALQL
jgi:hypothetical protein